MLTSRISLVQLSKCITVLIGFLLIPTTLLGAQSKVLSIQGKIIDAITKESIPGASILIKDSNIGTHSNLDGDFLLTITQGNTLQISCIGYTIVEKKVIDDESMLIELSENSDTDLFEMIPIGYGQIKKEKATGAISTLVPNDLNSGVHLTIHDILLGKMAGVYVYPGSGAPGDGGKIRVRMGASLLATDDPLILVDGMPMGKTSINSINPNDIASYTVLKDAAATVIYGSEASNGVILMTTKKGLVGEKSVKVNYKGNVSVSQVRKYDDVLSRSEFVDLLNSSSLSSDYKIGDASTDWQKEIYRVALGTDHHISATGGIKYLPYRVSLGYTNQNGIVKKNDYERFSSSVSLSPKFFNNHFAIDLNIKASRENVQLVPENVFRNASIFDPTRPVHEKYSNNMGLGYFMWTNKKKPIIAAQVNPVSQVNLTDFRKETTHSIGNLALSYKIHGFESLKLNVSGGYDYLKNDLKQVTPDYAPSTYKRSLSGIGSAENQNISLEKQRYDFGIQYDKEIGLHTINAMINYGFQSDRYNYKYYLRNEFSESKNDTDPKNLKLTKASKNDLSYYITRLNYSFASKLFLSTSLNIDKSSIFGSDNKWEYLPSLALAYHLSEEKFLKKYDALSALNIRTSYGITALKNFQTPAEMYDFSIGTRGLMLLADFKRERTTTYNVGVDFGFYKNRISGSVDFYTRNTKKLIDAYRPSLATGIDKDILVNIGSMKSKGVELSLNAVPVKMVNLEWSIGTNFTWNKSKLTKLNYGYKSYSVNERDEMGGWLKRHEEGESPYQFNLHKQVYDENGKPFPRIPYNTGSPTDYSDLKRSDKIAQAPCFYGVSTALIYKNWDLELNAHGAFGQYVYNKKQADNSSPKLFATRGFIDNVFKSTTDVKMGYDDRLSDFYLEKGNFFKLDHITIGYTFNQLWNKQSALRLAFSVQNVFVITKYSGIDPEIYSGVDNFSYQRPRIYALNFSLNF